MKQNKYAIYGGVMLLGGLVTGYLGGLFTPHSKQKKLRQKIKNLHDDDSTTFNLSEKLEEEASIDNKLQKIYQQFNQKIEDLVAQTNKDKKKKYSQVLESIGERLEEDKDFTQKQVEKINDYLKEDLRKFSKSLST